ncbi:protein translocase subunit SecD [Allobranchiibius huperziae]|uniref:Protein translocase subunit SecD n=1 Tax=Allobranchiibius huperziae TaxID=1874116 RepID=A0A853DHM9_9MICO|nr:preprotein translocase subunit SecD [Allobranchiibius huperziae]
MATRTRRTTPGGRPVRTLVLLAALVIALFAAIGASAALGNPAGQWSPKLGLDLEGGRQIVLQPSVGKGQTVTTGQVDQAVDIIRERVNGNGVSEAQVSRLGAKNIQVSLPGNPSQETLNSLAQSSQLFFRAVINSTQDTPPTFTLPTPYTAPTTKGSTTPKSSTSPSGTATPSGTSSSSSSSSTANDVLPQAFRAATTTPTPSTSSTPAASSTSPSATASSTPQASASSTTPARNLPTPYDSSGNVTTNGLGASDTGWESRTVSNDWITSGLATKGETYSQLLTAYSCSNNDSRLGPTAAQWQQVARQIPASQPTVGCDTGRAISGAQAPATKYLMGPSEVTGSQITDASFGQATTQQGVTTGQYEVNLTFNSKGSSEFAKVTGRLNGLQAPRNQFGIVVDGLVISAPSNTNGAITGGKAQITGNFTENSAKTLANQLKFGALPFSFNELTSSQVSPQLGSQQLRDGIIAGIIGLILVVLYSLAQYRLLGLVTIASLVTSAVITYGAVTLLGYTSNLRLTMAGVTGLIVAIGITADSFIVYFERVRDEVRSGRPLRAAVQTGWSRARRTVLVSDAVNFLAAAVLYILSEDNVKAFAFTLGLTTLIDILVVFLFTHPVLTLLSRTSFFGNGHKWSGFDPERLGARGVTYAGRGRVTIAERKAAAAAGKQA